MSITVTINNKTDFKNLALGIAPLNAAGHFITVYGLVQSLPQEIKIARPANMVNMAAQGGANHILASDIRILAPVPNAFTLTIEPSSIGNIRISANVPYTRLV